MKSMNISLFAVPLFTVFFMPHETCSADPRGQDQREIIQSHEAYRSGWGHTPQVPPQQYPQVSALALGQPQCPVTNLTHPLATSSSTDVHTPPPHMAGRQSPHSYQQPPSPFYYAGYPQQPPLYPPWPGQPFYPQLPESHHGPQSTIHQTPSEHRGERGHTRQRSGSEGELLRSLPLRKMADAETQIDPSMFAINRDDIPAELQVAYRVLREARMAFQAALKKADDEFVLQLKRATQQWKDANPEEETTSSPVLKDGERRQSLSSKAVTVADRVLHSSRHRAVRKATATLEEEKAKQKPFEELCTTIAARYDRMSITAAKVLEELAAADKPATK